MHVLWGVVERKIGAPSIAGVQNMSVQIGVPNIAGVKNVCVCAVPQVFRLSQLMLEAPEMSRVLAKARSKLLDLYGDLEKV